MLNTRQALAAPLALVVVLLVSACGGAAGPSRSPAATLAPAPTPASTATATAVASAAPGPLVVVLLRGGECMGGTCEQTVTIEQSGRVHIAAKPPNDLGVVGPVDLVALQAAIAGTDFNLLRTHKFTGECPTNYDGVEMVLTFTTPHGDEQLAACTTALDFSWPVLVALVKALAPIWPLPHQS